MKANPGYKWCPTTNKPVKSPTPTVNPRKKLWAFPSDSSRDLPSPKKAKTEEMPQLNFGMAGELRHYFHLFFKDRAIHFGSILNSTGGRGTKCMTNIKQWQRYSVFSSTGSWYIYRIHVILKRIYSLSGSVIINICEFLTLTVWKSRQQHGDC